MDSKRKFFLVFCFCVFDIFLLIGFLVIRNSTMLNTLKKEEKELLKINIIDGDYQRKIQSRGKYAIVEKSIKDYLDDYATSLQYVLDMMDNSSLTSILSYDNYSKDGPEFKESLPFLKKSREEFNKKVDELSLKADKENIKSFISKKTSDSYYVNLYNEFMLSSDVISLFDDNKELIESTKTKVNHVFDISEEILNFLITNKDSWKVEDGQIKFLTQELYNQYMGLVSKLA